MHLLDANVLISAGKAHCIRRLVDAATAIPWRITPQVFDEVTNLPERGLLGPHVRPAPNLDSPEAKVHADVLTGARGWKKLGNGEASSIAAALADPSLVFVTWDSPASWRALHELGDRVLVGHAWLGLLFSRGLLPREDADRISQADPRHHPLHAHW